MSKTVLITGAGGGLGSAVTDAFADAEWRLALVEASAERAEHLQAQRPDAFVRSADLTDPEQTQQVVHEAAAHYGRLDSALALVGGFSMQPAHEASPDEADRLFRLNFTTLFNMTQAVLPSLLAQRDGLLVGVSAAAADTGGAGMALYAASKAAVATYLGSLQDELAGTGVRIATLYPMGVIDTPANRSAMPETDPADWVDPHEIAQHLVHLAERSARGHLRTLRVYAEPSATASTSILDAQAGRGDGI